MYNVLLIVAAEGFFGGPLTHQAIHLRTSFKEVKVPKVGGGFASLQIIQGLANSWRFFCMWLKRNASTSSPPSLVFLDAKISPSS